MLGPSRAREGQSNYYHHLTARQPLLSLSPLLYRDNGADYLLPTRAGRLHCQMTQLSGLTTSGGA
mgnify:FL=1